MSDTIIQEIRRTREELAQQFNYDLHALCDELRREQGLSDAEVVDFSRTASPAETIRQQETVELDPVVVLPTTV